MPKMCLLQCMMSFTDLLAIHMTGPASPCTTRLMPRWHCGHCCTSPRGSQVCNRKMHWCIVELSVLVVWDALLLRAWYLSRLLRLWIRIPPGVWMSVCCECCVLSGRGLCDTLITHSEESYRLWCVVVWSRNLKNEAAMAHIGPQRHGGGIFKTV